MKFNDFVEWAKEAPAIDVNGTLCQIIIEGDDDFTAAIHFGDISEDIQDIDLDNDIDRFAFGILSAYIGDCEIELTKDQYDRPYAIVRDERTDEQFTITRYFQEGY